MKKKFRNPPARVKSGRAKYPQMIKLIDWIAELVAGLITKAVRKKDTAIGTARKIEINRRIYAELRALYTATRASGVYLYGFHNGGKLVTGQSVDRFSLLQEYAPAWISYKHHKGEPVSNWVWFMTNLFQRGAAIASSIDKIEDDEALQYYLRSAGIGGFFALPLKSSSDEIIGFVVVMYRQPGRFSAMDDRTELNVTTQVARILSGFLEQAAKADVKTFQR